MDDKTIEKLAERYRDLSGLLERREQEAADLEARRAEIVARRVEATGKKRQSLAGEFGQVDASLVLAIAELAELRARVEGARLAVLEARELQAQEELEAFDRDVFRPVVQAHETALVRLRRASNNARGQRDSAQATREALGNLQRRVDGSKVDRQLAAARRRELQLAIERARNALEVARREAAA